MTRFLIIFLVLIVLFSFSNVYGELSVELDKNTISPLYDPVNIRLKLNYVPQDNSVYVQIIDPMGNSNFERYIPVDQNGYFDISIAGDPASGILPLSEGIYVIKVTGMNNNSTITDKSSFVLHIKQKPLDLTEKKDTQNIPEKNESVNEIAKIGAIPLLPILSLLHIDPANSEHESIFYDIILIIVNIVIFFITPAIVVLKLKRSIANKINS